MTISLINNRYHHIWYNVQSNFLEFSSDDHLAPISIGSHVTIIEQIQFQVTVTWKRSTVVVVGQENRRSEVISTPNNSTGRPETGSAGGTSCWPDCHGRRVPATPGTGTGTGSRSVVFDARNVSRLCALFRSNETSFGEAFRSEQRPVDGGRPEPRPGRPAAVRVDDQRVREAGAGGGERWFHGNGLSESELRCIAAYRSGRPAMSDERKDGDGQRLGETLDRHLAVGIRRKVSIDRGQTDVIFSN